MGKSRKTRAGEESTATATDPQPEGEASASNGTNSEASPKKKQMVKQILDEMGYNLSPKDIQDQMLSRHGIRLSYNAAASHKTSITKDMGGGRKRSGKKRGRKPRAEREAAVEAAPRTSASDRQIEDIKTVKQLIRRHSAEWVRDILDLLS